MEANILILEDNLDRIEFFRESFLEDDHERVDIVTSAQDAIDELCLRKYDIIYLDHDLGGETYVSEASVNTGSEVVRWMLQNKELVGDPNIIIHSMNIVAAFHMEKDLKQKFNFVIRMPFIKLIQ